jgi:xanthine dehydrogenase YagS FAD-binding subunit
MFGATIVARGATHERMIAAEDFFTLPADDHRIEHTLRPDEVIVAVTLPARPATARSVYLKAMDRAVWAFALIGVAALLDVREERIHEARLVLSGVAPIPHRVAKADALLLNATPGPKIFGDAARLALDGAEPLSENAYKLPLAEALILRALAAAAEAHAT